MTVRRPRLPRLRTRVLVGVLAVTVVALAAFDFAAVAALRGYLIGQTDSQLRNVLNVYRVVDAILPGPAAVRNHVVVPAQVQRERVQRPASAPNIKAVGSKVPAPFLQPFSFTLVSGHSTKAVSPTIAIRGLVLGGNRVLIPRLPTDLARLAVSGHGTTVTAQHGNQRLRLMAMPTARGILVAATSLNGVDKTVGQIEFILIIGSAAAGLFAAGGVAWIMRRGLRPIEAMAAQADAITAGGLTDRVSPHDTRTEVGRLGTALNGMLARIDTTIQEREASLEATRRFFADASHELRTPLASLRANAELYQQGALRNRPQVDEAMRRIALEARRMSSLVDDMLGLARLDQHPQRCDEPVALTALVRECAQRAELGDPQREWHASIAAGLATTGDEELLRRAIDNLLGNVSAHTPAGTIATITAGRRDSTTVTVEVSDDGPGVPPERLPLIFERFYRGAAPSHRPGSGLGLAIVSAVAAAHGGHAEAALNRPHGLRVTLTLAGPAEPASDVQPSAQAKMPSPDEAPGRALP